MRSLHRDITQFSTTRNASDLPEDALKVLLFFVQDTMDACLLLLPVTALDMGVNYLFWFDFPQKLQTWSNLYIGSGVSIAFSAVTLGLIIIVNFFYLLSRPPFSFAFAEVLSLFIVNWSFFFWFVHHFLARTMLLLVLFASLRSLPPLAFEIIFHTFFPALS